AHDVPLGCAPDEYDDLISGTCSHLPCLVLSGKPAKDSTNQGWFVEYGAVAAPLPVCHPFMPASLSFLLPEDIHIRSAKKKPTFRYGSELLFSRKGSLWVHNP
ncbi:hypothetical protein NXF57_29940, partial [Klebsiella pneumoniae]|nr:hypothetical protein [Klebsiella pneumoniae]MDS6903291.1 hypothetical protein [Klebsiella pneumoniae]MDS6925979.1 hypothetical protein [Klebsiella pneumoniae]MDS6942760.1 hypothetical protein [Klebsiella pneumoniae]MDS6988118.1 hypothetical protein [Klebsiella pneumoniae]